MKSNQPLLSYINYKTLVKVRIKFLVFIGS